MALVGSGPPMAGYSEILPRQTGDMEASANRISTMFEQSDQRTTDELLLQSMPRDEGTRLSMTDLPSIFGRYMVDLYYTAKRATFSWETELLKVDETETLHAELRKHNVPAHILHPAPEGSPLEGVVWSFETLKFWLTQYGLEVRVRDGELQTIRGKRLFNDRVGELLRAFERTIKLHIHSTVQNAPLFAQQMIEEQGYSYSSSFRKLSDDKFRYFGILDTEQHLYRAHAYKQEEGLAAGLGPTPYTDVIIPRHAYLKMLLNKHATEASRFGEGAVENLRHAADFNHTLIPGLRIWPHAPEYIPTQEAETIDFFTREIYVGGYVVMDRTDSSSKIAFWNGSTDTHSEVELEEVLEYLPEFDHDTGYYSETFAMHASTYNDGLEGQGYPRDGPSNDPLIWKDDEDGAYHVAETYGEVDEKFRKLRADGDAGKAFHSLFLKDYGEDHSANIHKFLEWQRLLGESKDPDSLEYLILGAALAVSNDAHTEYGVRPLPRLVQDTTGQYGIVFQDGSFLSAVGSIYSRSGGAYVTATANDGAVRWPFGKHYPYGYATVDCMFQISDMTTDSGWDGTMIEEVRVLRESVERLERVRKRVMPTSRLGHSQFFETAENPPNPASEQWRASFASISNALHDRPMTKLWAVKSGANDVNINPKEKGRGRVTAKTKSRGGGGIRAIPDLEDDATLWRGGEVPDGAKIDTSATGHGLMSSGKTLGYVAGDRAELGRMMLHPAINANHREVFMKRGSDFENAWQKNFGDDYFKFDEVDERGHESAAVRDLRNTFAYFVQKEILEYAKGTTEENRSIKINLLAFALKKGYVSLLAYDKAQVTRVPLSVGDLMGARTRLPEHQERAFDAEQEDRIGEIGGEEVLLARTDTGYVKIDLTASPNYFRRLARVASSDPDAAELGFLIPSNPVLISEPTYDVEGFARSEGEFGLKPGSSERFGLVRVQLASALLLDVEGPFYTRDGTRALKKNLVERVRNVATHIDNPVQRFGSIHMLFSEVSVHSARAAINEGLPNPLGSIILFFPFVHFRMAAGIWFVNDPDTGRLLHTRTFFYQGIDINTQSWVYKMYVWIGGAIAKYENINLQPDVTYRRYMGGHDHSFWTKEAWDTCLDDNTKGYSHSIFPVCTGNNWGRSEAMRLGSISLVGTMHFEYEDVQLTVEDETRYRPKVEPFYPGALWMNRYFGLYDYRRGQGMDEPSTFRQMRERLRIDFVCERQQSWVWNDKIGDWRQITSAAAPFINIAFNEPLYPIYNHDLTHTWAT